MSRKRQVGDPIAWNGSFGHRAATGRVVAVVPAHTRPSVFRQSLPVDLARRWACANSPRHNQETYVVEVDGDYPLHYPHPRRILDEPPENHENGPN